MFNYHLGICQAPHCHLHQSFENHFVTPQYLPYNQELPSNDHLGVLMAPFDLKGLNKYLPGKI